MAVEIKKVADGNKLVGQKTRKYSKVKNPEVPCQVVVMEAVFRPDAVKDVERVLEDALQNIRAFGTAEVVKRFYVSTGYDETARVLSQRHLSRD